MNYILAEVLLGVVCQSYAARDATKRCVRTRFTGGVNATPTWTSMESSCIPTCLIAGVVPTGE